MMKMLSETVEMPIHFCETSVEDSLKLPQPATIDNDIDHHGDSGQSSYGK
jgi:hypothetical protein